MLLVLFIVFLLGPRAEKPSMALPSAFNISNPRNLDQFVADMEAADKDIKPGNAAEIVWADSSKNTTEYSVVYLHGFSASHEEGADFHEDFAKRYGANLYLARLDNHGLKDDKYEMGTVKADSLIQDAYNAIQIGKTIGNKVIVLTCSTGGTLGLYLASLNDDIHALFNYSPNVDVAAKSTNVLTYPWGLPLAKRINGSDYHSWDAPKEALKYWNTKYPLEALAELRHLLNNTMTEANFAKIEIPVFNAYYNDDDTVDVEAIKTMHEQLGSKQKAIKAFPKAGSHIMISSIYSKDLDNIKKESFAFAEQVVGLKPI
ncbi:MAG: alpha/beta hydrolase, partial [Bacteroidota bacterium]